MVRTDVFDSDPSENVIFSEALDTWTAIPEVSGVIVMRAPDCKVTGPVAGLAASQLFPALTVMVVEKRRDAAPLPPMEIVWGAGLAAPATPVNTRPAGLTSGPDSCAGGTTSMITVTSRGEFG